MAPVLEPGQSRKGKEQLEFGSRRWTLRKQAMKRDFPYKLERLEPLRHIYVHIPFCARICPYCAFYKDRLNPSETERFCAALLAEIGQRARDHAIEPLTIFFGGGTPTALSTTQLEGLLKGFHRHLDFSKLQEWTVEANPGSVSPRKANALREHGVSRISLGVQSWDDNLLRLLGREHNAAQAEASFQIFRDAGFSNISIDLMFGLPGQTFSQWQATLEKTISLRPDHISAYCLTYEEDTEFFERHARGELLSSESEEVSHFQLAMEALEGAGYEQYEVSNYARPGFASHHNQAYWRGADYLGIGPSAFSTIGWERTQNVADYRAYTERVLSGQSSVASTEKLTADHKRSERIALSLRTRDGLAANLVEEEKSRELSELGLLRENGDRLVLTRRGRALADSVAEALL
jgi:oxygen-independent coproporphyrinogen-3 oxidase